MHASAYAMLCGSSVGRGMLKPLVFVNVVHAIMCSKFKCGLGVTGRPRYGVRKNRLYGDV